MKSISILSYFLFTFFSSALTGKNFFHQKNITSKASEGFAVIELFTSEGCSSCPPADAAVASVLKEYNNVYLLGFHVDYWNNLGWKDVFSDAAYSKRQTNYARVFKLSSVYTPQVVINGDEQFVGSDEAKLHNAINKDLKEKINETVSVTAKNKDDKTVEVSFTSTDKINQNISIALIQPAAESQVKRGENSGATLHHVNIVRDFKTVAANSNQKIVLQIPAGLSVKDCFVIAFMQDAKTMKVMAATKSLIQ